MLMMDEIQTGLLMFQMLLAWRLCQESELSLARRGAKALARLVVSWSLTRGRREAWRTRTGQEESAGPRQGPAHWDTLPHLAGVSGGGPGMKAPMWVESRRGNWELEEL